ncbi:MAG: hypothetical protein ACREKE_03740 [bacterium]
MDITNYVNSTGISAPNAVAIPVDGFSGPPQGGEDEVALDIEMVAAMAPGLSAIYVYEISPGDFIPDDLLSAMADPPAGITLSKQISSSWTWAASDLDPEIPIIYEQYAAQGQTYFQAAGDSGAYGVPGDAVAAPPDPIIDTAMMPVVGGTELTTTGPVNGTAGTYVSETTWNDAADKPGNSVGSGGICINTAYGESLPIPLFQQAFIKARDRGG